MLPGFNVYAVSGAGMLPAGILLLGLKFQA
jgi:hypothetical protein